MATLLKISAHGIVRSGQPLRAVVDSASVRKFCVRMQTRRGAPGQMWRCAEASTLNDNRGPVRADALGAPQAKWRKVCRRAFVSSWFWQWFPQWALAPKKLNRCRSRLLSKPRTRANSKYSARACLPRHGGPVPTPDCVQRTAVQVLPKISAALRQCLCAFGALSPIRPADCHDRRQAKC